MCRSASPNSSGKTNSGPRYKEAAKFRNHLQFLLYPYENTELPSKWKTMWCFVHRRLEYRTLRLERRSACFWDCKRDLRWLSRTSGTTVGTRWVVKWEWCGNCCEWLGHRWLVITVVLVSERCRKITLRIHLVAIVYYLVIARLK